ncbi:MAG: methylmalonyl-CoA epimerase [Myxococcales bacterium]|nr:methylmalonyl-CoA epimerase [Myxococcales bacterium]MCB9646739.1 methylmalonyl-CoA epimerase [Deltaproteobacteria bacterium]
MKFKLDHIAVAVRDLDKARAGFEEKLGLSCEHVEEVPTEKARVAFFDVGGPHIELVSPTEAGSAIDRSIEKRGEGLHHICLEVEDIEATLALAKAAGLELINDTPRPGAKGTRVAFVHPKALSGVMVELVEKPR